VARVLDEASFALERRRETVEHLVQRDGERAQLVVGGRDREAVGVVGRRDAGGLAAHPFDRPERGADDEPPSDGDDDERHHTSGRERPPQLQQLVASVLQRCTDEDDAPARVVRDRDGEDPRDVVDAGEPAIEQVRRAEPADRSGVEERGARDDVARSEQRAAPIDDLHERLVRLDQSRLRDGDRAARSELRDDQIGSRAQTRVDRLEQVAARPRVDEHPDAEQQHGGRDGDRRGDARPNAEVAHGDRSR
jgi:hypothetical protein